MRNVSTKSIALLNCTRACTTIEIMALEDSILLRVAAIFSSKAREKRERLIKIINSCYVQLLEDSQKIYIPMEYLLTDASIKEHCKLAREMHEDIKRIYSPLK